WLIRELLEAYKLTGKADYLTEAEYLTDYVLDMLRKVPMVTVDGEDKIQLKGSRPIVCLTIPHKRSKPPRISTATEHR
ncbi:hypothetical protein, partial [Dysgonomonas sp. 511]|uniref:hypothetical protein n=1 Tax=Dysgonomonas sp. 511 TaxID=2302930 RepID=UPI0013D325B0